MPLNIWFNQEVKYYLLVIIKKLLDNYRDLFELQITNIINIYKCFTMRGKDIHVQNVSVCFYWSNMIVCICLFLTKACCVLWGNKMVNIVRLTLSVIFSISWQFGLELFKRGRCNTFYFSKAMIQPIIFLTFQIFKMGLKKHIFYGRYVEVKG